MKHGEVTLTREQYDEQMQTKDGWKCPQCEGEALPVPVVFTGTWQSELLQTMVENAHAGARTGGGPFYRDSLNIPPEIKAAIDGHVMSGKPVGSFVQAVLENNLKTAVVKADESNYLLLGAIIGYCCNEIPVVCWGSEDAVAKWARKGGWLAIYPGEPFRMRGLAL